MRIALIFFKIWGGGLVVKIQENTNTNRLGMESECIICIRFSKTKQKKKTNQGRPPPLSFARGENSLYIYFKRWKYSRITYILGVVGKLEKILTSNRQKGLIRHHLHSFFKHFLGETLTPPHLTPHFWPALPGGGASATGTPPLNFWYFDDVLCTSCCPSFNLAPFL